MTILYLFLIMLIYPQNNRRLEMKVIGFSIFVLGVLLLVYPLLIMITV
jgi:hypothetical protein